MFEFEPVSEKIKSWASTLRIVGIVCYGIIVLAAIIAGGIVGFLVTALSSIPYFLGLWISTLCLYGFGSLIEQSTQSTMQTKNILERFKAISMNRQATNNTQEKAEAEEDISKETTTYGLPLAAKLRYALRQSSDDALIYYLKGIKDPRVQEILNMYPSDIREAVEKLLETL